MRYTRQYLNIDNIKKAITEYETSNKTQKECCDKYGITLATFKNYYKSPIKNVRKTMRDTFIEQSETLYGGGNNSDIVNVSLFPKQNKQERYNKVFGNGVSVKQPVKQQENYNLHETEKTKHKSETKSEVKSEIKNDIKTDKHNSSEYIEKKKIELGEKNKRGNYVLTDLTQFQKPHKSLLDDKLMSYD
jgi:hypothetical protein